MQIQEAGKQILSGNPGKFYIFVGEEYGIKSKYISFLKDHYSKYPDSYKEVDSMMSLIDLMSTKHIIPLSPCLYIVRYDEDFIKNISESMNKKIKNLNIVGTIVCIYQSDKHSSKCIKYLPDYTVSFDTVNPAYIQKYLKNDFPNLNDKLIDKICSYGMDYSTSYRICDSLNYLDVIDVTDAQIDNIFAMDHNSSDNQFRLGVASRNFKYLIDTLEEYPGNMDSLYYVILNTMVEIDKLKRTRNNYTDISQYLKYWEYEDIYNMFMNTYEELKRLRSNTSYDMKESLIYILSLLQFRSIPSVEAMLWNS